MEKITLSVNGMHCTSCEDLIKMALEDIGITNVSVDNKKGIVQVACDPSAHPLSNIKAAIQKEGYQVV